jgi:phytoene dehydrogenase-like protein
MEKRRVDIVGGGLAGLIAAIELSHGGAQVTVWETAGEYGGRARTRNVDGYLFNRGPHALYSNGALKRELDRFGIGYSGGRSLSGSRKAIADGKLHNLPTSLGSIINTTLFGIRDKVNFARVFKSVMDGSTGSGSFADWLDEQQLSPVVRASVEAFGRLSSYANSSSHISANALLDQIRLSAGGTIYVDGGWVTLVNGLLGVAKKLGIELNKKSGVRRINYLNRELELTLSNGAIRSTDAVILAIGPHEAAALVPDSSVLQQVVIEALPVRANTLDLALRSMPLKATEFALGIDLPIYLSVHSSSARLAPEGGVLVHIAKYLTTGEEPAENAVEELEAIADLVMPGWREVELSRQKLRGMVVSNGLPKFDRPRPDVKISDAPGVFVAGDWVGDEGMIADASAASAIKAAHSALHWLSQ